MKIAKPSVRIEELLTADSIYYAIEEAGRVCYRSESKINDKSCRAFIKKIIASNHLSVIEHIQITATIECDRGVSHELVRHRVGSYSQESTRYCNYKNKDIEFIKPKFNNKESDKIWQEQMTKAEEVYKVLIDKGETPQLARSVLPNSLKTKIVVSFNLREWRHFFSLRCPKTAHPQMREIAKLLLKQFIEYLPVVFEDMKYLLED